MGRMMVYVEQRVSREEVMQGGQSFIDAIVKHLKYELSEKTPIDTPGWIELSTREDLSEERMTFSEHSTIYRATWYEVIDPEEGQGYKVPVFLPNSEVVIGEADVSWAADGNDVTIKMKLTPSFDGERMAGLLMIQETALSFVQFKQGVSSFKRGFDNDGN